MVSPTNSSRTGCAAPAGKKSTTPPRMQNSPDSSTGSWRVYPAATSVSARAVGSMSCPGVNVSAVPARRGGSVRRGSSAAADAMTRRELPDASAYSARARADITSRCGFRPRYGSISCDGNGSARRSTSASDNPSSAAKKNRASAVMRSTSASLATTSSTGVRPAAAATHMALAGGVRPATRGAATPIPSRPAADFSTARSVNELEV